MITKNMDHRWCAKRGSPKEGQQKTLSPKNLLNLKCTRISFVIVVTNSFKFNAKVIIAREISAAIAVRSAFIIFDTKG